MDYIYKRDMVYLLFFLNWDSKSLYVALLKMFLNVWVKTSLIAYTSIPKSGSHHVQRIWVTSRLFQSLFELVPQALYCITWHSFLAVNLRSLDHQYIWCQKAMPRMRWRCMTLYGVMLSYIISYFYHVVVCDNVISSLTGQGLWHYLRPWLCQEFQLSPL